MYTHKQNAFDLLSYETVRQQLNHVELIAGAAHAHHLLNLIVVAVLPPKWICQALSTNLTDYFKGIS